jgi:hypothetical protein
MHERMGGALLLSDAVWDTDVLGTHGLLAAVQSARIYSNRCWDTLGTDPIGIE